MGTGHALLMARDNIHEPFAVINADDFYGSDSYQALTDFYKEWKPQKGDTYCMIGYELGKTLLNMEVFPEAYVKPMAVLSCWRSLNILK